MENNWTVNFLNDEAENELFSLPEDIQARFYRIVNLIETQGLERIRKPHIKPLGGKLWEMRMIGKDGIARSIYVTAKGKRVIVLHSFIKKTEKTPLAAIETAKKRAKELKDE